MPCNMNLMCYITFKLEFIECIPLYALRGDTKSLYEYMRTLASQELNPVIIPPDILKRILHKIEEDIKSNTRLKSYVKTLKLIYGLTMELLN